MRLQRLIRLPEVLLARGISRAEHYRNVRAGLFTKPVHIGPKATAWPEGEVSALNSARIAGFSDEQIRHLVASLEKARQLQAPQLAEAA